jgi:putative ATPase
MSPIVARTQFDNGLTLALVHGDLTKAQVSAIVNAANERLSHGAGLAAAIVRAGGPYIQTQSDRWVEEHGPVSHDRPAITGGGQLPAKWVIHAVGPRWGVGDEDAKLAAAVGGSLELAAARGFDSLGLPPISTGIFGFPVERAADVILDSIATFAQQPAKASPLRMVQLTILDQATLDPFLTAFKARWPQAGAGP